MFCLEQSAILGRWAHHADQLGFSLAMLESQQSGGTRTLDIESLSAEWNFPTYLPEKCYRGISPVDIKALHYHGQVDEGTGLLKPSGVEWVDKAIRQANHTLTACGDYPSYPGLGW